MDPRKNALAPIEFIVSVAGGLMLFFLVLAVPAVALGDGSMFGLGEPDLCLSTPMDAVQSHINSANGARVIGLDADGSSYPEQIHVCTPHPSAGQRSLYVLTTAPEFLFCLGFLYLTWRLIRYARREGFFVADFALQLGRLGLYVLCGALLVAVVQTSASTVLLPTLVTTDGGPLNSWLRFFHLSWAVLFAGFGLLTINRVMAQTVPMQAEIDATI